MQSVQNLGVPMQSPPKLSGKQEPLELPLYKPLALKLTLQPPLLLQLYVQVPPLASLNAGRLGGLGWIGRMGRLGWPKRKSRQIND